jgi:pSer/pThr/pTyr-binding forkhead associated (FHA) protein
VPVELSRIISKMIAFAPEYRYQRAGSVVSDLEKEYLYARGYGPTNNSLAAYIDTFKSDFQEYNEEQLQQLSFLKDETGQIALKRPLTIEGFTKTGQRLLAERKGAMIVERLRDVYKKKQKATVAYPRVEKFPILKAQYLNNVLEAFCLQENPITVGRGADCTVALPYKIVSGHHAKFYLKDGTAIVEDTGSQNGTFLNGTKVPKAYLQEGDKIQIGKTLFYFLREKEIVPPERITLLDDKFHPPALTDGEMTLQFLPKEDMLLKLMTVLEEILQKTNLGEMRRNVIPITVNEVVQFFASANAQIALQLRILRAPRYLAFYCKSTAPSSGYDAFCKNMLQRMNKELNEEMQFTAEEFATSLILKSFDRIEMSRTRKDICLLQSLV